MGIRRGKYWTDKRQLMAKIHKLHELMYEQPEAITINLIGLGGNGMVVFHNLVKMHLTLKQLGMPGFAIRMFDPDVVAEFNVGRQMFVHGDIGHAKVSVIAQRYHRAYDGFIVGDFPETYNGQYPANITITCVDSVQARQDVHYAITNLPYNFKGRPNEQPLYWLDLGNGKNYGQYVLATVNDKYERKEWEEERIYKLKNVFELYPAILEVQEELEPSCSLIESLSRQDLFINPMIANFASHLLWELLQEGYVRYQGGHLNLESMSLSTINL